MKIDACAHCFTCDIHSERPCCCILSVFIRFVYDFRNSLPVFKYSFIDVFMKLLFGLFWKVGGGVSRLARMVCGTYVVQMSISLF